MIILVSQEKSNLPVNIVLVMIYLEHFFKVKKEKKI